MLQTMPRTINNEVWLSMGEAAEYTGWSRTTLNVNIPKYQERTGNTVTKLKDGQESLVKQSDLDAMLIELRPFKAREKGLIKED